MRIHIIKPGDTLYSLASKYHVTVEDIMKLNPNINADNLQVGSKIRIPTASHSNHQQVEIVHQHIVKAGDSFWKLSQEWGVTLDELVAVNKHIANPNTLKVGDVINIPKAGQGQTGQGQTGQTGQTPSGQPSTPTSPVGQLIEQLIPGLNYYTVVEGDTLYKIAQQHNISLDVLIAFNPQLSDPNKLTVGMKLVIPRSSALQSGTVQAQSANQAQTLSTKAQALSPKAQLTSPMQQGKAAQTAPMTQAQAAKPQAQSKTQAASKPSLVQQAAKTAAKAVVDKLSQNKVQSLGKVQPVQANKSQALQSNAQGINVNIGGKSVAASQKANNILSQQLTSKSNMSGIQQAPTTTKVAPLATENKVMPMAEKVAPLATENKVMPMAEKVAPLATGNKMAPIATENKVMPMAEKVAPLATENKVLPAAEKVAPMVANKMAPMETANKMMPMAEKIAPMVANKMAPMETANKMMPMAEKVAPLAANKMAPMATENKVMPMAEKIAPMVANKMAPVATENKVGPIAQTKVSPVAMNYASKVEQVAQSPYYSNKPFPNQMAAQGNEGFHPYQVNSSSYLSNNHQFIQNTPVYAQAPTMSPYQAGMVSPMQNNQYAPFMHNSQFTQMQGNQYAPLMHNNQIVPQQAHLNSMGGVTAQSAMYPPMPMQGMQPMTMPTSNCGCGNVPLYQYANHQPNEANVQAQEAPVQKAAATSTKKKSGKKVMITQHDEVTTQQKRDGRPWMNI